MTRAKIVGNLVNDIAIEIPACGEKSAHFKVASDRRKSDGNVIDFLPIRAIGEWVEDLRDLSEGMHVTIKAVLQTSFAEGRPQIEIIAREIDRRPKREPPTDIVSEGNAP